MLKHLCHYGIWMEIISSFGKVRTVTLGGSKKLIIIKKVWGFTLVYLTKYEIDEAARL